MMRCACRLTTCWTGHCLVVDAASPPLLLPSATASCYCSRHADATTTITTDTTSATIMLMCTAGGVVRWLHVMPTHGQRGC